MTQGRISLEGKGGCWGCLSARGTCSSGSQARACAKALGCHVANCSRTAGCDAKNSGVEGDETIRGSGLSSYLGTPAVSGGRRGQANH